MQLFTAFPVYSLDLHTSRAKNKTLLLNPWFDSASAWQIQLNEDGKQFETIQRYTLNPTASHSLSGTAAPMTSEFSINKTTAKYIKCSLIANRVWTLLLHKAQLFYFLSLETIRSVHNGLCLRNVLPSQQCLQGECSLLRTRAGEGLLLAPCLSPSRAAAICSAEASVELTTVQESTRGSPAPPRAGTAGNDY